MRSENFSKDSFLYKELLEKEVLFFDENNNLNKFRVIKIKNNFFVLRRIEETIIIDIEIPIIEVLALNFPDSEKYIFSTDEWKNFWLKYGGYLPTQTKIDKEHLSIKEAREIFSKLPSYFEKILLYFLFPNEGLYKLLLELYYNEDNNKDFNVFDDYLRFYVDLNLVRKITYMLFLLKKDINNNLSVDEVLLLERNNSLKREMFFGRRREIELYSEEERLKLRERLKAELIELIKIREPLLSLEKDFYHQLKEIQERLNKENLIRGRSTLSFFVDLLNIFSFPLKNLEDVSDEEIKIYLLILFIKNNGVFFDELIKSTEPVENFIIRKFLTNLGLDLIIMLKPQFIISPTTNVVPFAYFYRNLLRFTKKILVNCQSSLADNLPNPKFILFDFISRNDWSYFRLKKINNQYAAIYFLNLFREYSLDKLKEKAILNEFNLDNEVLQNLLKIINDVQRVINKLSKYKLFSIDNIRKINDFESLINGICFMDDFLVSGDTYFYSMYILLLALLNMYRYLDFNEMYRCFKKRFLVDFINMDIPEYFEYPEKLIETLNKPIILTSTDFFKNLIPFLKFSKREEFAIFTYYPGFKYTILEKYFPSKLIKEIIEFSRIKITILKKMAEIMAKIMPPYLVSAIKH